MICGDVGAPAWATRCTTGSSSARRQGEVARISFVEGEWTDANTEFIERERGVPDLGTPPEFQKFVCRSKKLYNYNNLEPSERKLVL